MSKNAFLLDQENDTPAEIETFEEFLRRDIEGQAGENEDDFREVEGESQDAQELDREEQGGGGAYQEDDIERHGEGREDHDEHELGEERPDEVLNFYYGISILHISMFEKRCMVETEL